MITSTANAQVKNVIQLKKKPKERTRQDLFLVEGLKMMLEAPADRVEKLYLSESFFQRCQNDPAVAARLDTCAHEIVSDTVFDYMSDTKAPQGVLCLIRQYHYKEADLFGDNALCIVLENLQDPGNLGTILRTAEGAGVTGILMSADTVDLTNPKVIRSTMGSIYRMPFLYVQDLAQALSRMKAQGIALYAAHLGGSCDYDRADYHSPSAFLIGNESRGLTGQAAALADVRIRIPMLGKVESLNAAVAASILMYEAARQRRE